MIAPSRNPTPPQGVSCWSGRVQHHRAGATRRPDADHRQAAHYIAVLNQHLRRIDRRIVKCLDAIASSVTAGDIDNIHGFRSLLKIEQQERRLVEGLLENLRSRFLPAAGSGTHRTLGGCG